MSLSENTLIGDASWIWLAQDKPTVHQYVCFRKRFETEDMSEDAVIDIAADSDFVLCLNGREISRGQFSDYPQRKTFTRARGRLKRGENLIAVLAYYRGEDTHEYRAGRPGLILALQAGATVVTSDGTWKALLHPAFQSGPMPRVTVQMGFTAQFDARADIAWRERDYSDHDWPFAKVQAAATGGYWEHLTPRPVAPLHIQPAVPVRLVTQGDLRRRGTEGSIAATMSRDSLVSLAEADVFAQPSEHLQDRHYTSTPAKASDAIRLPDERRLEILPPCPDADGRFLILDVGREEVGLLTLSLEAPAGTVLDIGHGEHLDDGRVRVEIDARNFADRYICGQGRNRFTLPFRRLGARYLEIHLTAFSGPVKLNYIGLKPVELEVKTGGGFRTHDGLAERIYTIGRRTLHLCMHEHYEDCPWREQSLYAFDARNQALYGYYAFGNYDFAEVSFDLLGQGLRQDGLLELCAPARPPCNIPSFSLVWITALAEHWMYSGRPALFTACREQVERILETVQARHDPDTGLYGNLVGEDLWHFYDWMDGLAGHAGEAEGEGRLDAPYNLFVHEALDSYAWMLAQAGQKDEAACMREKRDRLAEAVYRNFWSDRHGALATYAVHGKRLHIADLVQYMALCAGIVPAEFVTGLLSGIFSRQFHPTTLSTMLYQAKALMKLNPETRAFMADEVRQTWGAMALSGATSFWETSRGGDDFQKAGSLCHGWSALPVYYYQAWVLGVRPTEPGFRTFLINPYPSGFFAAEGSIPTPDGPIEIEWTRPGDGIAIRASGPRELRPLLTAFPEAPVERAMYNDKPIPVSQCAPCGNR